MLILKTKDPGGPPPATILGHAFPLTIWFIIATIFVLNMTGRVEPFQSPTNDLSLIALPCPTDRPPATAPLAQALMKTHHAWSYW